MQIICGEKVQYCKKVYTVSLNTFDTTTTRAIEVARAKGYNLFVVKFIIGGNMKKICMMAFLLIGFSIIGFNQQYSASEVEKTDEVVETIVDGNVTTTTTKSGDSIMVLTEISDEEVFVDAETRAADLGGGSIGGTLVSTTNKLANYNKKDGTAYVSGSYNYTLYKYKTGSRYYYWIKNIRNFTCKGYNGVVCNGTALYEYKNTSTSGKQSYVYVTPRLSGSANMVATSRTVAPRNT